MLGGVARAIVKRNEIQQSVDAIPGGFADTVLQGVEFLASQETVSAIESYLVTRFTDPSQQLRRALQRSADRTWRAFEVALSGEYILSRLTDKGEDKEFRADIRAFLDSNPLQLSPDVDEAFRHAALTQLRAARRSRLIPGTDSTLQTAAKQAARFLRYSDPRELCEAEWQTMGEMAGVLKTQGHSELAKLVELRPVADGPPLLAVAVRFFFRREVETNSQLFQGLVYEQVNQIEEALEHGLRRLYNILQYNSELLEQILSISELIHDELQDLNQNIRVVIHDDIQDLKQNVRVVISMLTNGAQSSPPITEPAHLNLLIAQHQQISGSIGKSTEDHPNSSPETSVLHVEQLGETKPLILDAVTASMGTQFDLPLGSSALHKGSPTQNDSVVSNGSRHYENPRRDTQSAPQIDIIFRLIVAVEKSGLKLRSSMLGVEVLGATEQPILERKCQDTPEEWLPIEWKGDRWSLLADGFKWEERIRVCLSLNDELRKKKYYLHIGGIRYMELNGPVYSYRPMPYFSRLSEKSKKQIMKMLSTRVLT